MTTAELARVNEAPQAVVATLPELTVDDLVERTEKVGDAMKRAMRPDFHYGVIPGTGTKPTLLKPGAEKLCLLFQLAPTYLTERDYDGDHLTVTATCTLRHIASGAVVADGVGLCTTREKKYAYRTAKRACPECGEPQLRRSKFPPKGALEGTQPGWYCWRREGGCGAEFVADDSRITGQEEGTVANPDLPDSWNTVLKMAEKRALIAAVLNGTAASDVFTQDLEDAAPGPTPPNGGVVEPAAPVVEAFKPPDKGPKATKAQVADIEALIAVAVEGGVSSQGIAGQMIADYGTPNTADLTKAQAENMLNRLKAAQAT